MRRILNDADVIRRLEVEELQREKQYLRDQIENIKPILNDTVRLEAKLDLILEILVAKVVV